jgi:hypothetical protein
VLNDSGTGPVRSVFVVAQDGTLLLANRKYDIHKPWQFEAIFSALGGKD